MEAFHSSLRPGEGFVLIKEPGVQCLSTYPSLCVVLAGCFEAPLEITPKYLTPLLRHYTPFYSHHHHSFVFQCCPLRHLLSMSISNTCCMNAHSTLFHQ